MKAAEALGSIGEGAVDAVPTLAQALQDQDRDFWADENIRYSAAGALKKIGTPEALDALKKAGF